MSNFNVVVLASVGGGNFEALAKQANDYHYIVTKLITNKVCGAVDKAIQHSIAYDIIEQKGEKLFVDIDNAIPPDTDLIVLAGFMPIVPVWFCKKWHRKIINIHPSLLPKYGGKGMYGVKVQEAVMAAHEEYGGCTVHYVEEGIDTGEILEQWKMKVDYNLTPWDFGGEVYLRGTKLLPMVVGRLVMLSNKSKA